MLLESSFIQSTCSKIKRFIQSILVHLVKVGNKTVLWESQWMLNGSLTTRSIQSSHLLFGNWKTGKASQVPSKNCPLKVLEQNRKENYKRRVKPTFHFAKNPLNSSNTSLAWHANPEFNSLHHRANLNSKFPTIPHGWEQLWIIASSWECISSMSQPIAFNHCITYFHRIMITY